MKRSFSDQSQTSHRIVRFTVVFVALIMSSEWLQAQSVIQWDSPTATTGTSDVVAGSGASEVLYAFNGGSTGTLSIAGISFEGASFAGLPAGVSSTTQLAGSTFNGVLNGATGTGDVVYETMLNSVAFASGSSAGVIEFSGLTAGTEYQLQIWFCDQRPNQADRVMTYGDDGASNNVANLTGGAGSFGHNVVGSFTASAGTQRLSLQANGFAAIHLNGLVLSTEVVIDQDPIDPIVGPDWIVDTADQWAESIDHGNSAFSVGDGFATSRTNNSVFQSRVQSFTTKRSFQNMTLHQNKQWTANKWGHPSEVDPAIYSDNDVGPAITGEGDRDAPVFLLIQEGDYWVFDRQASGRSYHAYHSSDMINWLDKGIIGAGYDWVTTSEYHDGKIFIYTDRPNDHDPSLLTIDYVAGSGEVFDDNNNPISGTNPSTNNSNRIAVTDYGVILDKPEVTVNGTTYSLAGGSDNCVFRDPSDGQFHIIHENWSRHNAERFSWDSNIASHAISPDGINGFVFDEAARPINVPGNFITQAQATDADSYTQRSGNVQTLDLNGILYHIGHHPNVRHLFRLTDQLHAWGDWTMIKVGTTYYLFADDDREDGIGLGYWYGDSLNEEFTYGGRLRDGLHPDPGVGFAEGNFLMMMQSTDRDNVFGNDLLSYGPWVKGIEAQAGVDVDGDGQIDQWTDWQDVSEEYSQIEGFSKAFDVQEATLDASALPTGYGVAFRIRSASGSVVFDSIEISSEDADEILLGDINQNGVVNFFDVNPFITLLSMGVFQAEADINGDGTVNFFDIGPFITILSQ